MAVRKNRIYTTDSYYIAVMRHLFMKLVEYKFLILKNKLDFEVAWHYPISPSDFLGETNIMFHEFRAWINFLNNNKEYIEYLNNKNTN